jgi:ABC-2 type transport system permease protein
MLGMYLASPLTRRTYLLSKVLAVTSVLAAVTLGPPLLLLLAFTLQGRGPSGIDGWLLVFVRIVAAGTVVAVLHAAISLAVSSLTDRRAVASAGVVLTLLVTSVISENLVQSAGVTEYARLFDLLGLPFLLVNHIYGRQMIDVTMSTGAIVAAYVFWTALAAGVVWWRYQRIAVTR